MRDVILTPEQTENLLRGFDADGPPKEPEAVPGQTPAEAEQAQMAGDFFTQVPQEPAAAVPPAQQPVQSQVPPGIVQQAQQQAAQGFIPQAPVEPVPPAAVPQVPQVPPAQVPVQSQISPEHAAANAQLALMNQEMQALRAQVQQMQGPQQPQQGQEPQGFNFNVPPQFMAAINHEDAGVRQQALSGLMNGVANAVATQMRQEMQQQMEAVPSIVQSQTTQFTRQQQINQDMYTNYPELEQYRHLVGPTAEQVAKEMAASDWSPQLRDEIARRLAPLVPGLYPRVQQNMASRVPAQQQALPQAQVAAGIPQHYAAVQAAPVQQQGATAPMLVRDAQGNLVPVVQTPQSYQLPAGTRPGQGVAPNPELQDIWRTLGYTG
jgi:hypothetical protein